MSLPSQEQVTLDLDDILDTPESDLVEIPQEETLGEVANEESEWVLGDFQTDEELGINSTEDIKDAEDLVGINIDIDSGITVDES